MAVAFPDLEFTLEYLVPAYCDAGRVIYRGHTLVERLLAPDVESVDAFARRYFGAAGSGEHTPAEPDNLQ